MRLYQKPSGIWAVDYVDTDGTRKRVSTGKRDKSEARKVVAAVMAGETPAADQRPTPPSTPTSAALGLTMDALWRRVENSPQGWRDARSQATIRSNLRILRATEIDLPDGGRGFFKDLLVTSVTKRTLQSLVEVLEGHGYAPATVKRKMDMVSKSLTLAEDWEEIPARPRMPSVKIGNNSRSRVVSATEETAIFAAISARAALQPTADWVRFGHAVAFFLDSGCRKAEVENLQDEWITEVSGRHRLTIPAWVSKNNKPRTIPLTDRIVAALPYLRDHATYGIAPKAGAGHRKGHLLFPYRGGFLWYRWQIIVSDLKAKGFDLSDVVIHSFRHTTLTRLSERGLPIEKVKDWAGHSDISITVKTYRHVGADALDVGADLLAVA